MTVLIQYPLGVAGTYSIPAGVTDILYGAFYGCSALTGVYFPASVTNIGEEAFSYCFSLTGLFFAGSPPMWYNAFDVDNFSAITFFPSSPKQVGDFG